MQASDTHIKWIVGDINREFWYDQITEGIRHCEWVVKWHASWIGFDYPKTLFHIDIHDEEEEVHTISSLDVLTWLQKAWLLGDRTFEEEQQVDQDVIDTMLQELCFGELVYG